MSLERFKRRDLIVHYLIILFTTFIYFYIRLTYRQSVFFDFDMPRVVLIVQDFLSNGTFMESQYYMQESVWLNVPWGPMLIFFYSFFLKINSDPLVVANMLTLFHFIGIIFIIKFGWRYCHIYSFFISFFICQEKFSIYKLIFFSFTSASYTAQTVIMCFKYVWPILMAFYSTTRKKKQHKLFDKN